MEYKVPSLEEVKALSALKRFTVISTFAGFGGSSTGYRMAGGDVRAINEFIPAAIAAYRKNYPTTAIVEGDIRKIDGKMLLEAAGLNPGELDIFDGSPPCKSFSMAGKREKGWGQESKYSDSSQRTDDLFYEYARVLKDLQPKVFVAENVKGIVMGKAKNMLGSSQSFLFEEQQEEESFYKALTEAGYEVRFKVLNAANYGVPQARERTIFIGTRKDLKIEPSYPKRLPFLVTARQALEGLEVPYDKDLYVKKKGTKTEELWENTAIGDSFDKAALRLYKKAGWFSMIRLDPDKPIPTVVTTPLLYRWDECRTLSLAEVKRLSSFPDDYYCGETYSKGHERLGRAVPPFLMKEIANHIYETILKFL